MNVLHIGSYNGITGGVATYIITLTNNSNNSAINYYIATSSEDNEINDRYNNATNILFDIRYNIFKIFSKAKELNNIISNYDVNVIHAHTQRAGFLISFVKLFNKNIKFIYTPHGLRHTQIDSFKSILHKLAEVFILKKSNLMTAITNIEQIELSQYKQKIIKIDSVIDITYKDLHTSLHKKFNISENKNIIVMVGSLIERKQPELFLDIAIKTMEQRNDISFVWIGGGPLFDKVNKIIINKKLEKNIHLTGHVNKDLLFTYLKGIDVFLMTSSDEGFPLSILEAYYFNKLVVSNNFNGVDEIINQGENGYIFNFNCIDDAVNKLDFALNNNEVGLMKEKIENFMKKHIDITKFSKEYENLYMEIGK